jgi:hypothetical protein
VWQRNWIGKNRCPVIAASKLDASERVVSKKGRFRHGLLGYPADDEPMPIAAREKPQNMPHEVLHTLSDANLLIRFHAQRNSLAVGVQRPQGRCCSVALEMRERAASEISPLSVQDPCKSHADQSEKSSAAHEHADNYSRYVGGKFGGN